MQPLTAKLAPNTSPVHGERRARSSNKRQAFAVIKTKDPRRERKTTVAESAGETAWKK